MNGGSATGRITLGGGNDTVTVNGGTMTLTNGTSAFGGGTDSLTVNNNGTLVVGDATNGSKGVTVTGLNSFTLNAGSSLRLYLTRTNNNFDIALTLPSAITINGTTSSDAPIIAIYLPSGITLGDESAFTLIDGTDLSLASTLTFAELAARVRIYTHNGSRYSGTVTLSEGSADNLQIAWQNLTRQIITSSMNCITNDSGATVTCSGGDTTHDEFLYGMDATDIFRSVNALQSGTRNGDFSLTLLNLAGTVNTNGTDHAIMIDGSKTGSRVTGSITVNLNVTGTKQDVSVRGANKAALYVKSAVGVTITNGGNLLFAGTPYNNGIRGIEAISASTGNVSIRNSATIGFATNCTTNCGTSHRGIFVNHGGSGTVSISNSGNINVGSGAAIALTGGSSTTAATINLTSGTVTASEIINSDFSGNITMTVSGGSALGRITLGGGSDTVTIGQSATLTTSSGAMNFGGGTDAFDLAGTWVRGGSSGSSHDVTVTALETFHYRATSTLRLYVKKGEGASCAANAYCFVDMSGGRHILYGTSSAAPSFDLVFAASDTTAAATIDLYRFPVLGSNGLSFSGITERQVRGFVTRDSSISSNVAISGRIYAFQWNHTSGGAVLQLQWESHTHRHQHPMLRRAQLHHHQRIAL